MVGQKLPGLFLRFDGRKIYPALTVSTAAFFSE
jgi:hypothetical protein